MKSAKRNRRPSRKLAVETLENRCLLAVSAFVDEGVLNVTGDDTNDEIRVTLQGSTCAKIEGLGGTTINGGSEASFCHIIRHVAVDLGGGDDCVIAESRSRRPARIKIHTGSGNDVVDVQRTSNLRSDCLQVSVDTGDGDDHVIVNTLSFAPLDGGIRTGAGNDRVEFHGEAYSDFDEYWFSVNLGDGDDVVRGDPDPTTFYTGLPLVVGGDGFDRIFEPGYFVGGWLSGFETTTDCPDTGCVVPGNVNVQIDSEDSSVLVVTGDLFDNDIRLNSARLGTVVVESGATGTTINGTPDPLTFTRIKHVTVDLGSGADTVLADGLKLWGCLDVITGYGDDTVDVQRGIYRSMVVNTGGGADAVTFDSTLILGKTEIDTSWDDDTVALIHSIFGRLTIHTGDGADDVTLDRSIMLRKTKIVTGWGEGEVTIRNSIFARKVILEGGLDEATLNLLGENLFNKGLVEDFEL